MAFLSMLAETEFSLIFEEQYKSKPPFFTNPMPEVSSESRSFMKLCCSESSEKCDLGAAARITLL